LGRRAVLPRCRMPLSQRGTGGHAKDASVVGSAKSKCRPFAHRRLNRDCSHEAQQQNPPIFGTHRYESRRVVRNPRLEL
jgi:hypothetical protein